MECAAGCVNKLAFLTEQDDTERSGSSRFARPSAPLVFLSRLEEDELTKGGVCPDGSGRRLGFQLVSAHSGLAQESKWVGAAREMGGGGGGRGGGGGGSLIKRRVYDPPCGGIFLFYFIF